MNLAQFLLILQARYKIALFALVVTVAATLAVSLLLPRQYTATATVVLDVKSPDPIAGMMLSAQAMPGYIATQMDIFNSDRVAVKAVKLLKWDQSPEVMENWKKATEGKGKLDIWLAKQLQGGLEIRPSRESSVIAVDYTESDPQSAAAVANAIVQAYIETTIELKVEPAKQYSLWFGEQGKALRENLENAQARLSAYQQKYGIIVNDERLDNETTKLSDLTTQLTRVLGETTDAHSKQRSGAAGDTLPEVVQNPVVFSLRTEIARQEARLQELAGNLGKNHPQYQRQEAEIAALKRQLETETRHITSGFSTSRSVSKDREADLTARIWAQKKKLLELKNQRDQVAVLMRDVEAANKAYDAVSQRLNQASLESQATQTNVSVLTPASPPTSPSSPKIVLNTLMAMVLGTMLGIGAALTMEWSDRRIRSAKDLADMLQLPVLGVIGPARGESRLAIEYRKPALALK